MSSGADSQNRFTRSIGLAGAIAIGAASMVGAGVFVILGQVVKLSDAPTASLAYVLALIISIPIILTLSERVSYLPIQDGVYGLSRQSKLLSIPYYTGWLMFGGPVIVDMTVVSATGTDLVGLANLRELEEYLEEEAVTADVTIAELTMDYRPRDIFLYATLVLYPESTLNQELLDKWQQEMSDTAGQPVVLEVSAIQG